MSPRLTLRRSTRGSLGILAALAITSACGSDAAPGFPPPFALEPALASVPGGPNGRDITLADLRAATARFHNFETATEAGYSVKITDCMVDPTQGGMGFHYGKGKLIDALPELLKPEVLLYEPLPGGKLRLVGVEYVIPFTAWTSSRPPKLWGQEFKQNHTFQVWALHAWIWKQNPKGIFADWNPTVSCANAPVVSTHNH